MYKMFVFDIDGTLVPHFTHEFSDDVKKMFRRLKEQGYIVTLATGRDFISIAELYKTENIDYFIGANGAFIYDLKNNKYLFNSSIDFQEYKKLEKDIFLNNKHELKNVILSDTNNVFVWEIVQAKSPWFWEAFKDKFKDYELYNTDIQKDHFHLVTIAHDPKSNILNILNKYFDENDLSINIQSWWNNGLFISNKGINKASTIQKLVDHLSIDMKNVVAFGDGENDIEMIKEVGLGVAMGNAIDILKDVANDVTINVEDCGTKYYLEKKGII